jgi:surface antigen
LAQISKSFAMKAVTITLAISTLGPAKAMADIDPAVCGAAGLLGGGAIGNQFGGGNGKIAMTILGAFAGAVTSHNYCKQAQDPEDIRMARQNEREMLMRGSEQPREWSNPRYGRHANAHSSVAERGWYGNNQCTKTRTVTQASDGGRYVNETLWCNDGGQWTDVTETTVSSQIRWGANGPVQSTTTQTTTTYDGGRRPLPPQRPAMLPQWIVNENRIARFQDDLKQSWPRYEDGAREIARDLSRAQQFMTLDQMGRLLRRLGFDSERDQVLQVLAPYVDQQFGSMASVTAAYRFDREGQKAGRFLDRIQREKEIGSRHDRRGDRREPWPHRR